MKFSHIVLVAGLGLLLGLLAHNAHCQVTVPGGGKEFESQTLSVSGNSLTFNDQLGTTSNTFEVLVSGTPATISISIAGVQRGGTSTTLATSTTTTNQTISVSGGPYDKWIVTASWTGGASPSITVNRTGTTAGAGSPTISGNVNVVQPTGSLLNVTVTNTNTQVTGNITNTQSVQVSALGAGAVTVDIFSSPQYTGTIVLECTMDNVNWNAQRFAPVVGGGQAVSSIAALNGTWTLNPAGFTACRARGNTVATNTAVVTWNASQATANGIGRTSLQYTFCYITTATTTTCRGTAGVLHRISVNTPVASATVKAFNVPSGSCVGTPGGNAVAIVTVPAAVGNPFFVDYDVLMANGVCIVTSGATDVTVAYE